MINSGMTEFTSSSKTSRPNKAQQVGFVFTKNGNCFSYTFDYVGMPMYFDSDHGLCGDKFRFQTSLCKFDFYYDKCFYVPWLVGKGTIL